MKKGVILLGSSNSKGDTFQMATFISQKTDYPIIDLKQKNIGEFDYEFKNQEDDSLPLFKEIVINYDLIVFATPVYWYSMSGIMKTFFDRISDCLKIEKEVGRRLKGMEMAVLTCASDKELKEGFHMPFIESAKYLGMTYLSDIHGWVENGEIPDLIKERLSVFSNTIARVTS